MTKEFIYISGGARSGKSGFSQKLAEKRSGRHLYLATAQAYDAEMTERIQRHQDDRDYRWLTIEAPLNLAQAIADHHHADDILLVDCITLWLTNHMLADSDLAAECQALCDAIAAHPGCVILVSNEVGMGIVPENALARAFRDEAGRVNQRLAAMANEAYLLVSGLPLRLDQGR